MNIAWWVQRWSELHPDKAAILFEGSTISYLELHERGQPGQLLASIPVHSKGGQG